MEHIALGDHERIVFFTGAGLSAESGVPTYRGAGGIWGEYDYGAYACQRAFDRDPAQVWDFHDLRRERMAAAQPSAAHRLLARIQAAHPAAAIVTQNIDGLHQRAGAHDVIELHGSIWRVRCRCPDSPTEILEAPIGSRTCPSCGTWRRPDIVWFEDPMQPEPIDRAMAAIEACDLLVSIGTSGVVHPAAALPRIAADRGALTVEVNPEETPVSGWYARHVRLGAGEALAGLFPEHADECDG